LLWHDAYLVITHDESSSTHITLFDPAQKYVAYSDDIRDGLRAIVSAWGGLFLISREGKVSNT
jgi:hypothetical protein